MPHPSWTQPELHHLATVCWISKFSYQCHSPLGRAQWNQSNNSACAHWNPSSNSAHAHWNPAPNATERKAGSVGFFISEDLTPLTFKLLHDLQRQQNVDKAWTVDGRIRYVRTGDADRKVYKVKSIFDSVSDILRRTWISYFTSHCGGTVCCSASTVASTLPASNSGLYMPFFQPQELWKW